MMTRTHCRWSAHYRSPGPGPPIPSQRTPIDYGSRLTTLWALRGDDDAQDHAHGSCRLPLHGVQDQTFPYAVAEMS